ncbi:MAG: hypothetical protein Q9P01_08205 [Anaerolineae bacterium]|nr:hypothetical protein [Anaerolineae bacterium]MDQ7034806.1 hypothetical protein [Anaerolineae bacterium]
MEDFSSLLEAEFGLLSRRLRGMAMISRGIVPNLVISQRMVDRVVKAAQSYIADETGETMVGLVVDTDEPETMPMLYVLDTILPDESTIRRSHMFETGDEMQQDIFFWLLENWNAYQTIGRDMSGNEIREEWKVDLKHLGDWHKQPGFMIQPSGGDLMTALRIMDDAENGFDFLLVPIVTLGHPSVTSEVGATVNYFTIPQDDGTSLRMDWWYIHRDVRVFQPISPKIVGYDDLPELTPYPWHILHGDLLNEEIGLLQEDNKWLTAPNAIFWESDNKLPLEICFIVGTANSHDVFLVITDWDYPKTQPRIRMSDFGGVDPTQYIADVFAALWDKSKPAPDTPDFKWDAEESYIVDYLAVIEKKMGIRPDGIPMPWERQSNAVSIAVDVEGEESNDTAPADGVSASSDGKVEKTEPVAEVESDDDEKTETDETEEEIT